MKNIKNRKNAQAGEESFQPSTKIARTISELGAIDKLVVLSDFALRASKRMRAGLLPIPFKITQLVRARQPQPSIRLPVI